MLQPGVLFILFCTANKAEQAWGGLEGLNIEVGAKQLSQASELGAQPPASPHFMY